MNTKQFAETFRPKREMTKMRLCEVPLVGVFALKNLCEYSTMSACGLYREKLKHKDGWRKCLKQCTDPVYVGDFKKGVVKEKLPSGDYWYHEIELIDEFELE